MTRSNLMNGNPLSLSLTLRKAVPGFVFFLGGLECVCLFFVFWGGLDKTSSCHTKTLIYKLGFLTQ